MGILHLYYPYMTARYVQTITYLLAETSKQVYNTEIRLLLLKIISYISWTFVVTQVTHEVEAILFQIHDTCFRFGSTYKHYGNFTSQLTRTKHHKNIYLEISFILALLPSHNGKPHNVC